MLAKGSVRIQSHSMMGRIRMHISIYRLWHRHVSCLNSLNSRFPLPRPSPASSSLHLLQRDKPTRMCRPNPRPSMLHRLVTNAELPQVKPHHLRLDLHLVILLAAVNPNHGSNHLRHDNHVSQVRLHQVGLLVGFGVLFRAAEFLDKAHGFAFQAAVEAAAGAGVDDVAELGGGEVEKSAGRLS